MQTLTQSKKNNNLKLLSKYLKIHINQPQNSIQLYIGEELIHSTPISDQIRERLILHKSIVTNVMGSEYIIYLSSKYTGLTNKIYAKIHESENGWIINQYNYECLTNNVTLIS